MSALGKDMVGSGEQTPPGSLEDVLRSTGAERPSEDDGRSGAQGEGRVALFANATETSSRLAARRALAPKRNARYSRFVSRAKIGLPAVAATLLLLIAAWPYLSPLDGRFQLGYATLNLKDALELKMLNARFSGIDKSDRTYTIVSKVARQIPKSENLVSLESPKAELHTHSGDIVTATSNTGIYQSPDQMLDLFGNVVMHRANGDVLTTESARVNIQASETEGHDPVDAHGGFGNAQGEGLRVVDRGDTIIFTGRSHALLLRTASAAGEPAILASQNSVPAPAPVSSRRSRPVGRR